MGIRKRDIFSEGLSSMADISQIEYFCSEPLNRLMLEA